MGRSLVVHWDERPLAASVRCRHGGAALVVTPHYRSRGPRLPDAVPGRGRCGGRRRAGQGDPALL